MHRAFWAMGVAYTMLFVIEAANAGHMRCGGHIIEDGLGNGHTKYEILKKCGEPAERYGNTWIYNGSETFKKVVRFKDDGTLFSIRE